LEAGPQLHHLGMQFGQILEYVAWGGAAVLFFASIRIAYKSCGQISDQPTVKQRKK
jgi:hypothetical protein